MAVGKYLKKLAYHTRVVWMNRRLHRVGLCTVCGYRGLFYAFDQAQPDERLMCPVCRSISRNRLLARQLLNRLGLHDCYAIRAAKRNLSTLRILDSAGNGPLSRVAGTLPLWTRGYYGSDPAKTPRGFRFTDLQDIRAKDDTYDIIITEDVLEHIPRPQQALNEISRVLKPGGFHLFTVPYDPEGPMRTRAIEVDGVAVHHEEPAYHFDPDTRSPILVFTDFGQGFDLMFQRAGMSFEVLPALAPMHRELLGSRPVYLSVKPR